jgi:predicted nucleotidyltransferase component of viral defense system
MKDHLLQTVLAQPVERRSNLAREYLQLYLLRLMHDAGSTGDLAFVGGTALRLLNRLPRFSEALDFCHEPLPKRARFDAADLFDTIERGLSKAGYDVTVKAKPDRTVASAFFRFQGIPREAGWNRDPHLALSVKVEADLRPPKGAVVETTLVQRFFPVSLRHYDLPSLFAGKLHAILARRWAKGRDWFDLVWYLTEPKGLEPNLSLLENALKQTRTAALPREGWRAAVRQRLETLDWKAVISDLRPFVERQSDLELLSKDAIHKLLEDG